MVEACPAPGARKPAPIFVANTAGEWAVAVAFCAAVFQVMWTYHDLWRNKPYSLGTANECFALAAASGSAAALALGPLHRLTGRARRAVRLRRPLGVTAVLFAVAHVAVTVFLKWEPLDTPGKVASLALGIVAAGVFLALGATSWPFALRRLGAIRWRRLHGLSDLLVPLVLLHFLVLGKIPAWIQWFRTIGEPGHLPAPQGTLPVSLFLLSVVVLRVVDARRGRLV